MNRELHPLTIPPRPSTVGVGELVGQIVEADSEILDGIPKQQAHVPEKLIKVGRDVADKEDVLAALTVLLGRESWAVFFQSEIILNKRPDTVSVLLSRRTLAQVSVKLAVGTRYPQVVSDNQSDLTNRGTQKGTEIPVLKEAGFDALVKNAIWNLATNFVYHVVALHQRRGAVYAL